MALTDGGCVFAFGRNDSGQCGVGKDKGSWYTRTPTLVNLPSSAIFIACGRHTLIILKNERIYSCGDFDHVPKPYSDIVYIPKPILALKHKKIKHCADGGYH